VRQEGAPASAAAPPTAGPSPRGVASATALAGELRGIPASIGIAIGTLQFLEEADLTVPNTEAVDPPAELEALELA